MYSLHVRRGGYLCEAPTAAARVTRHFRRRVAVARFATYAVQRLPLHLAAGSLGELADQLQLLVTDQSGVPAWHAALALSVAPTDRNSAGHHATLALALGRAAPDFTWLAAHVIGRRAATQTREEELV